MDAPDLVAAALAAGAEDVEAYVESGATHRITFLAGRMADSAGDRTDVALRCWAGGRHALHAATGATAATAHDAVELARTGVPGKALLARPWPASLGHGESAGEFGSPDLAEAEELVAGLGRRLRTESAFLLGVGYTGRHLRRSIANSGGLSVHRAVTEHDVWCWLEGPAGHVRLGASAPAPAGLAPDELARELLELAGGLTAGASVPSGVMPVLFGPLAAAELAGAFARLLCGHQLLGDLAVLREKIGRRIAAPAVTLVDEAAEPFDGEGTPGEAVTLIEDGRLRAVLHSLTTAHALGMAPNGKARRADLSALPAPAPARACLRPGPATPEELLSDLGTGPLITGFLTAGRVRSGTGRFSAVGHGWWVRRGVLAHRISGVAVSAGVFELLRSVVACGDDLRYAPLAGGAGAPSVLVSGMRVS